jgi:hypothetical protein
MINTVKKEVITLSMQELQPYIKDDVVRPNISVYDRVGPGKKTFALKEGEKILAVMCVSYGYAAPVNEEQLQKGTGADLLNYNISPIDKTNFFITPYTLWSYAPGMGSELLRQFIASVKESYSTINISLWPRIVTMSPKTPLATKFHSKHGAKLISDNEESNSFEYFIR